MTKEGANRHSTAVMHEQDYHRALAHDLNHFLKDLRAFKNIDSQDSSRLIANMENSLKLIIASTQEIKRSGISKEGVILDHAFKAYMKNPNEETYSAVENAAATLVEYNS